MKRAAPTPSDLRALVALVVLATALRLPGLNGGLWFDEIWMLVDFVRQPLSVVWGSYPTDNHHPLYTLLASACVGALGEAPWVLRLPAFFFGVACIPATFVLARPLFGPRVALLAGLFLAFSLHHVSYSQNARGYTASLFFVLLASHGFLEALRRGERRAWVLQGIALALATYAHLTAIFVALGMLLVSLALLVGNAPRARAALKGLALGAAASLALHAPMLGDMLHFFLQREPGVTHDTAWRSPWWSLQETVSSLGLGALVGSMVLALTGITLGFGLRSVWQARRSTAVFFVLPAFFTAAALLTLGRNLWPRLFFASAGFAVIIGAQGLQAVLGLLLARAARLAPERAARWAFLVTGSAALASAALLPRVWNLPKQDFAAARDFVEARAQNRDPIFTLGLASFPYSDFYGCDYAAPTTVAALEERLQGHPRAYFLHTFPLYLRSRHPQLFTWITTHTQEVGRFRGSIGGGDLVVLRFAP